MAAAPAKLDGSRYMASIHQGRPPRRATGRPIGSASRKMLARGTEGRWGLGSPDVPGRWLPGADGWASAGASTIGRGAGAEAGSSTESVSSTDSRRSSDGVGDALMWGFD
jgi:hypothetical protein